MKTVMVFKIKSLKPSMREKKRYLMYEIISDKPDYVIILAWHLKNMIIKLLRKKGYRGNFIIPLPKLKIIRKK